MTRSRRIIFIATAILILLCLCIAIASQTQTATQSTPTPGAKAPVTHEPTYTPPLTREPTPISTPRPPTPTPQPKLEVLEIHDEVDGLIRYISGTVRNNTNHTYSYVQININLYDSTGARVGSTMDNINNLEPGGLWKFRAIVWDDRATKYAVKEVIGW